MRWKVLVTAPYMQPVIDRFRDIFTGNDIELIVPPVKERLNETELLEWIKDIDGVISGNDQFTKRVLGSAKNLKVISKWGTGIDSIDLKEAKRLNIKVCNTPDAFTEPVADTVFSYILSFARKIPWTLEDMRSGKWEKRDCISLNGRILGVIGVGNIGKAVIRRAIGFGMKILGNDIVDISDEFLKNTGTEMVSKEDLLRKSDFVSLNCTLNPTSYHLIGENEFRLMKPTAYLINTARGPIIEEKSLIKALQKKLIAGAALDVFEIEPLPIDSPLRSMENCILSPHNSNSSPEAWEFVHKNTIKNLLNELKKHTESSF